MTKNSATFALVSAFLFTTVAFAGTYSGGTGAPNDPYQIADANDWQELTTTYADWNKHFLLTADIDLSGITVTPVGYWPHEYFTGTFDGNNHIIRDAAINLPSDIGVGLFGYVVGGQIKNVSVENVDVLGSGDVGGLVGSNDSGSVSNCHVTGSISGTGSVGSLVGYSFRNIITGCSATCQVTGNGNYVGGLVGYSNSILTSCYAAGSVNGTGSYVGGLVGYNYLGTNSFNGSVTSCYATSIVTGAGRVGGLVGKNNYGRVSYCYATGYINGGSYTGGLVGENYNGTVTTSFWDVDTSGQATSAGGIGKTTVEMQTQDTFTSASWDFVGESANGLHDFWQIAANDYPRFAVHNWTLSGEGTADSPYLVESTSDLARVWLKLGAYYRLNCNLDLSGMFWSTAIVPGFTGVFDGNDYVIRNMGINLPNTDYIGLFGYVNDGQIKNIRVEDVNVTGLAYVGGLIGYNEGDVNSCYMTGSVNGVSFVGGLVGYNQFCSITSCYAAGDISGTGSCVGGLIGKIWAGHYITTCYATGSVTGAGNYVGGLIGYDYSSYNLSCYATGSVSGGGSYVGGLIGYGYYDSLISCYAVGEVNGSSYVGGLMGEKSGSVLVRASFWDTETSGLATSAGGTGLTTEQMKTKSTFTGAGWDFINVWRLCTNGTHYPWLSWQHYSTGDLECPDGVEFKDYAILAKAWQSSPGNANWNPICDISDPNDDIIDNLDLVVLCENWLEAVMP